MVGSPVKRERNYLAIAELASKKDEVLAEIAAGRPIRSVAKHFDVAYQSLWTWLQGAEMLEAYRTAQLSAADVRSDEAEDIAQETLLRAKDGLAKRVEVDAAKLAIESKRYVAGVLNRRKYGQQIDVAVTHTLDIRAALSAARERSALPERDQQIIDLPKEAVFEPITD